MSETSEHFIIFQFRVVRKMHRAENSLVVVSNFFRIFFSAALSGPQMFDVGVGLVNAFNMISARGFWGSPVLTSLIVFAEKTGLLNTLLSRVCLSNTLTFGALEAALRQRSHVFDTGGVSSSASWSRACRVSVVSSSGSASAAHHEPRARQVVISEVIFK